MTTTLLLVLLGVFGLAVGSFLNVVIVRVPSEESLLHPPSKCPLCEKPIEKRDNIPVVSWLLLKGKCRNCGEPIPAGYPLVEIANALLWVAVGVRFNSIPVIIAFCLLFSVLLVLSVIDLELYILPNRITYPTMVVSALAIPVLSFMVAENPGAAIMWAYICAVAFAGLLLLTLVGYAAITRKDGMGMGDVKLAVILGMWLGWLHPVLPLVALIVSSFVGIVVGVGFMMKRGKSDYFPFGPSLAIGTIIVVLAANPIIRFYGFDGEDEGALRSPVPASFEVPSGR
ncbi:MAG: prepilin peptidase [Acidimicrobiales bacterium]|nr:prepilin peptidase [Acidimicrobiales bacterium]